MYECIYKTKLNFFFGEDPIPHRFTPQSFLVVSHTIVDLHIRLITLEVRVDLCD